MSLVTQKGVFVNFRPGKTHTSLLSYRDSWSLEILDIEIRGIILSKQRITKALMHRLICAFVVRMWQKQVFS